LVSCVMINKTLGPDMAPLPSLLCAAMFHIRAQLPNQFRAANCTA